MSRRAASLPSVAAWRAFDASGVGHAIERRRSVYTYCGVRVSEPRHDWPVRSRCLDCTRLVGDLV